MTPAFLDEAAEELTEAVGWYEARRPGLGKRLRDAIQRVLARLVIDPLLGVELGGVRRMVVPGFPYVVVYRVEAETLVIVAVAHTRRRPGYWRGRDRTPR